MGSDVFVSYARSERSLVEPINAALIDLGLTTFFDVEGIDGGDHFPKVIDDAIRASGAVLALWTPLALSREWVQIEGLIAKDRKVLVAAEISPIDQATDVPAAFYTVHRTNLVGFDGDPAHEGWLSTIRSLSNKLKQPALFAQVQSRAREVLQERAAEEARRREQAENARRQEELARREAEHASEGTSIRSQPSDFSDGSGEAPRKTRKFITYE